MKNRSSSEQTKGNQKEGLQLAAPHSVLSFHEVFLFLGKINENYQLLHFFDTGKARSKCSIEIKYGAVRVR